jgi:N-acetylneuraminic acid mutarotase
MRFHGTMVSLLIFTSLISLTGCGSSNGSGSAPTAGKAGVWTWEGGSGTANTPSYAQPGVYGTLGAAASGNVPGGRDSAASWTDRSGNFWLFGGFGVGSTGVYGYLNDLWEFNPAAKVWTWVSGTNFETASGVYGAPGVAAAGNVPGGRTYAASWIDSGGNLWLFGGTGLDSFGNLGVLNDLWEFNPATREWEWVSGSFFVGAPGVYGTLGVAAAGNVPSARYFGSASWTDSSGNLWLFGGNGRDSTGTLGMLNELWEFNPATKEWTWVSGSNLVNAPGVYGTLGVAAAGDVPGSRYPGVTWTDSGGNLWLFGGHGRDATGTFDFLNDLWEFNPAAKEWKWVSGSNLIDARGVYGTPGVAAAGNVPSSRIAGVNWIDSSGNLWLFGGVGFDSTGTSGTLDDLWKFDPASNEWTWMSGANSAGSNGGQSGVYGTLGVAAAASVSGSRYYAVSWADSSGNLWLFGGYGFDSTGTEGYLNDLWKYQP